LAPGEREGIRLPRREGNSYHKAVKTMAPERRMRSCRNLGRNFSFFPDEKRKYLVYTLQFRGGMFHPVLVPRASHLKPDEKSFELQSFVSGHRSPERIFIPGFAACILLGTLILRLPFSTAQGPLSFIDGLFTPSSAVCVTGLATIDIGKDLSFAGRVIAIGDMFSGRVELVSSADFMIRDSDIFNLIGKEEDIQKI